MAALDTLKELGDALGNDANFAATMTTALAGKLDLVGGTLTGPLTGTTITATSFVGPLTGNASTATTLATARTINGTSFNGSANITTANWGTARTLTIGSSGKSVNGSANVSWSLSEIGAAAASHTHAAADITDFASSVMSSLPAGANGQVLKHNGTTWVAGADNNTTYSAMSQSEAETGTATSNRVITAAVLKAAIAKHAPINPYTNATDNRTIKPNAVVGGTLTPYFVSKAGLTGSTADAVYGDLLVLNTYKDSTGGSLNALFFGKDTQEIIHYTGAFDGTTWANAKTIAYTTSNVATATKLQTVRTINGTNFDGSANITTANWGTARTLTIGRTGKSVNGSANVSWSADEILPTGTNGQVLKHNGTSWVAGTDNNTTYSAMSQSEADAGTATTGRIITAAVLKGAIQTHAPAPSSETVIGLLPAGTNGQVLKHNGTTWVAGADNNTTYSAMSQSEAETGTATSNRVITAAVLKAAIAKHAPTPTNITGNAGTATKLATARTINGVAFDGSANITITAAANGGTSAACSGNAATATKLATARTLTIGSTAKSFDGSANVSWTLAEIGAAAASHTHAYLPTAGGAMTGQILARNLGTSWIDGTGTNAAIRINGNGSSGSYHSWICQRTVSGGAFSIGILNETFYLTYGPAANVNAGTNAVVYPGTWDSAGNYTAAGNVTAYSDRRLKENIEPINDALAKVEKLKGCTFNRIDTKVRQAGLIAQDVRDVLPEAVLEGKDEMKTLSISYGSVVGLLVEAIKELNAKVEQQAATIRSLRFA